MWKPSPNRQSGRLSAGRMRARPPVSVPFATTVLTMLLVAAPSGGSAQSPTSTAPAASVIDGEEWLVHGGLADDPEGRGSALFLVRPDGTGEHRLVHEVPGTEIRATWSPDGMRIAYVQTTLDDRSELWAIDADGSHAERLFRCEAPCNSIDYPDWAPDGDAIYFQMDANVPADGPPATFGVARYDLASGQVVSVLTREDGLTVEQPRIAPDGARVVYFRGPVLQDPHMGSAIFVADLSGGPETRLTDWALFAAQPDWSIADRIVFNSYDIRVAPEFTWPEPHNLYTVAPDGTRLTQLTTFGRDDTVAGQARWTPDGTGITYTEDTRSTRHLGYIGADGTGQRRLAPGLEHVGEPELRPVP